MLLAPFTVLDITHDGTGRLLWRVPVRERFRVDLDYTNSLFYAPATDRFVVEDLRLRLVEISSTREAVLLHAGLEGPFEKRAGRFVAKRPGPVLAELTIRIGQIGKQRLVVGGRRIPIWQVGVGEAVRLRLSRVPRVLALIGGLRAP
ncbi:MAG: hypothetical protein ACREJ4_02950 [Candidatus Methylomirabilaceae bacterium]